MAKLQGQIEFPAVPNAVRGGTLRVRLVDVSRADAPARAVAEEVIPDISIQSAADRVGFALEVPDLDPTHTYAIEAHLDVQGSGETSSGDYRTMEHFEVRSETVDQGITVRVRPVV